MAGTIQLGTPEHKAHLARIESKSDEKILAQIAKVEKAQVEAVRALQDAKNAEAQKIVETKTTTTK